MSKNEYRNLKILYVEDEELIRKNAVSYLNRLFNNVYEAKSATEALEIIKIQKPHIVITDIKMPKINGLEMIRRVREYDEQIQFIVLSAFTDTKYLLDAIDLKLVKYLIKPIRHETIYPLLLNCAKKVFFNGSEKKYISKNSYFNLIDEELFINDKKIKLSKTEGLFLKLLCENSPRVVSYVEVQNYVWEGEYMSDNALRLLVRDLRKKVPKNTIKNLSKVGYKID